MFFSKILSLAALALAPIVSAQGTRLQFTSLPGPFTIGKAATIRWTGGSGDPVTLILKQGEDTSSLETVGIIGNNVKGNSFTWTPADNITPGDDFLLQITQGLDGNSYSGLFSIQSAAAGAATTIYAVAGSSTVPVATITPNSTSTITMRAGTAASGTGTGINMPRNTTMVSPTLSTTATITASVTSTGSGAASASSTGGALAQATAQAMIGLGAIAAAAVYLL